MFTRPKPVCFGINELSRHSTWVCTNILPLFPLFITDMSCTRVFSRIKSRIVEPWCGTANSRCWLQDAQPALIKTGTSVPSGQSEAAADFTRCTSKIAFSQKKSHTGSIRRGRNEFFMTINHFKLCTLYIPWHASGADKSPAGGLMKSSSPAAALGGCTKHM